MRKTRVKRKLSLLLSAVLCTNLLWSNIAIAEPITSRPERPEGMTLGDYKSYNAVVWGDHTASHADIEGGLAVKGTLKAPTINQTFDVGAAYPGSNAIGDSIKDFSVPVLLLGGDLIDNGCAKDW